ncbi:MAG: hypothetical protein QXH27_05635 [Candidatus Micrarchaeia archaeon]
MSAREAKKNNTTGMVNSALAAMSFSATMRATKKKAAALVRMCHLAGREKPPMPRMRLFLD